MKERIKMKKDTYLMVNGQKIELTAEQKKQLGIVEEKNCFDRVGNKECYYGIYSDGKVGVAVDSQTLMDDNRYAIANYCTDKDIMHQRALHEILSRLLWRYSMTHDGDKIDWDGTDAKWMIACDNMAPATLNVYCNYTYHNEGSIYFYKRHTASNAIEEIVKPFMKEHPDFVW